MIERDFTVEKMRIDGEDIPIIEAKKTDRGYEVWCGSDTLKSKINTEVKIEIEILTKKAKGNRTYRRVSVVSDARPGDQLQL